MLTRVLIENYRGFETFRMADLARVNLLVGKNNSGKTAILEGIQFLTSKGDPAVLAEAAERRGEVVVTQPEQSVSVDIAHFFHGHAIGPDASFSFAGDNGYAPIAVKAFVPKEGRVEREDAEARGAQPGLAIKITSQSRPERKEPLFPLSREGGVDLELPSRFRRFPSGRRSRGPQMRFIGPDSLSSREMAVMWDELTLTGQESDVASALRVLDHDLESLHFLTGVLASGYFPSRGGIVVGVRGRETRVPLGSMGDGMRRLMALAASLAFAKEGCLFVDEIDTGLHYSVMPDMWKLVIAKAIASNTQVFATTHSWDCIEGLSLLCQREPEFVKQVAIHKIDRALPNSVGFSGESLVRMLKSDIDPR